MSRLGHVHTAADGDSLVRNREVVASLVMRRAAPAKRSGDLLFVGFFVFAEANVAIDAKDGFVWICCVFGSEIAESEVQRVHKLAHRLFNFFFEECFAWQEPFAIIVARESAKELQGFEWKAGKGRAHRSLR